MNAKPCRRSRLLPHGRRGLLLLFLLALPLVCGAWREVTGRTINPRFVQRIKDGQTKKHEILLMFGEPQEVNRTPEGVVFTYKSYKAAEGLPKRELYKLPDPQSSSQYFLEEKFREEAKAKKAKQAPTKVPASTLTIRFQPDGDTVKSHDYQEH